MIRSVVVAKVLEYTIIFSLITLSFYLHTLWIHLISPRSIDFASDIIIQFNQGNGIYTDLTYWVLAHILAIIMYFPTLAATVVLASHFSHGDKYFGPKAISKRVIFLIILVGSGLFAAPLCAV